MKETDCRFMGPDCDGPVTYRADPFSAEIYEDYTKVWMCEYHRYVRAQDI